MHDNSLSMLHFNIRSMNKNTTEFKRYIQTLNFSFDILGFSETWLNEGINDLYQFDSYKHYHTCSVTDKKRRRGSTLH